MSHSGNLVSVQWLLTHINDDNLVILEASMSKPLPGKSNKVGEEAIPGARHFDFEKTICDQDSHLPNMMPGMECFETEICKLGVNHNSTVVVYDNMGVYSSPRAWWMLKMMGHNNVFVLNGGLPAWKSEGGSVEPMLTLSSAAPGNFKCTHYPEKMVPVEFMLDNLTAQHAKVVDARSLGRFSGEEADPRPQAKSGHIPASKNLHYAVLQKDGHMLPAEDLARQFEIAGLSKEDKIVFSCGSGVTACILALGANEAGYEKLAVYDGSWSEWGASNSYPIETNI